MVVMYLYSKHLLPLNGDIDWYAWLMSAEDYDWANRPKERPTTLTKTYVLADKFGMEELQDAIIDAFHKYLKEHCVTPLIIDTLVDAGLCSSMLYDFITREYGWELHIQVWEDEDEKWVEAGGVAVKHVFKRLVEICRTGERPLRTEPFYWHIHHQTKCER